MPFDAEPQREPSDVDRVLQNAQALIERGWCQRYGVTDRTGLPVPVRDAEAANFCIVGAVNRALSDLAVERDLMEEGQLIGELPLELQQLTFDAEHRLIQALPRDRFSLPRWNDEVGRTKDQVVELFQRALEAEDVH